MIGRIYKVENNINSKVYVGQTTQPLSVRWSKHLTDMLSDDSKFYRAMLKHGAENFQIAEIEVLEFLPENIEELNEREQYWIDFYDAKDSGYNSTLGGKGSILYNYDEVILKYEELQNMKEVAKQLGMHCVTVSNILKNNGVAYLKDGEAGKKVTAKQVSCYDLEGVFVETFPSQTDAGRWAFEKGLTIQTNPRYASSSISKGVKTGGVHFQHYWSKEIKEKMTIRGGKLIG